jgi:CheY-like chemotaxis protein
MSELPAITRILCIEDDADDQYIFRQAMGRLDIPHTYSIVNNGKEALDYLQTEQQLPHIIFLDLNMPEMNGVSCLRELKSSNSYNEIPVIILSTSDRPFDIQLTQKMGARNYVIKQTHLDTFCEKIYSVLVAELSGTPLSAYLV